MSGGALFVCSLAGVTLFASSNRLIAQAELVLHSDESRLDIVVRGQPFTSYHFGPGRSKPILFPVRAPGGRIVNRLFPLQEKAPDEEVDHPHQESLWFTYGDVEGLDFWSGRDGVRIRQRSILEMRNGRTGVLKVLLDWVDSEGHAVLQEIRRLEFGGSQDSFWLDHRSDLLARERSVKIGETKEGMFGIRVAGAFREDRGQSVYLDAFGRHREESIWGTRVPWVALQGELSEEPLTIAIFDHPSTFNHPSYWHARAYGLFAANPLGRKDFVEGSVAVGFEIRVGERLRFRYRLTVYSAEVKKARLDSEYQTYIR